MENVKMQKIHAIAEDAQIGRKISISVHRLVVLCLFLLGLILGNLWGSVATRKTANREIKMMRNEIINNAIAIRSMEARIFWAAE